MHIRIEDQVADVVGKAAAGWGMSPAEIALVAGIEEHRLAALLEGARDDAALRAVAPVLKLDAEKLVSMANHAWYPDAVYLEGLEGFNTPHPVSGYEEMTVNSYLVWNARTREAVVFDAGTQADMMLGFIWQKGLAVKAVFLTHTHSDHVKACDALLAGTGNPPLFAPQAEPYQGAQPVVAGDRFELAGLRIEARLTNGHSPGGTTYVVDGLARKVAMVGDSLFCLSQGGAKAAHAAALENNRREILSLAESTVLCPGHGPVTTVGNEKLHNPFFPNLDS
jgi:glyoxylase-like metal-dependent hydrolase (beta-lactamase superfamily II)